MKRYRMWRLLAVAQGVMLVLFAVTSSAQDVSGLTFDVTVTTGDSATGRTQTGRGWIAGRRSRLDFRGPANPAPGMPGMPGENISLIVLDSGAVPIVAMVDHDTKTFTYPTKMLERLREMMASVPEQPRMTFGVTNIVVDTLGQGETISGFATKRFKLSADITMAVELMGERMDQSMRVESEADYAEELSGYSDPFRDTRGFRSFASTMPWMDSTANAQMEQFVRATPRGLALRQVDVVTGAAIGGEGAEKVVTALSNIRREAFPLAVFAMPEGYTESEMPQMPQMN